MALQPLGPWPLLQFLNLYTVDRTPWTDVKLVARPLPTRRTTQTQSKCRETFMLRVEFELTIPMFEREKAVHALGRAATVIGCGCEIVRYKNINKTSLYAQISKYENPRKICKNRVCFPKLNLNYARYSGTHPHITCELTLL
jgi:hypothetical protein